MQGNLADWVGTNAQDVHAYMFPTFTEEKMKADWDSIRHRGGPEMLHMLDKWIDALPLPADGTPIKDPSLMGLPDWFGKRLAVIIDEVLPHWNIPQKAMLWHTMAHRFYDYTVQEVTNRMRKNKQRSTRDFTEVDSILNTILNH